MYGRGIIQYHPQPATITDMYKLHNDMAIRLLKCFPCLVATYCTHSLFSDFPRVTLCRIRKLLSCLCMTQY